MGKTLRTTAILGEALKHGLRGRWESQSDWLRDIKASWKGGHDVDPEHRVWRRSADAGVLLFDDFGGVEASQPSDRAWWRTQVTHLLHYRECRLLPTIVTANLTDWRQVRRVHESLVSRMDVPLKIALPSMEDFRARRWKRRGR